MKLLATTASLALLSLTLAGCGSDTKETTVVHDRPVIVQQAPSATVPSSVETTCAHGYDNSSHSCY